MPLQTCEAAPLRWSVAAPTLCLPAACGGLDWAMNGCGYNRLSGWFVVDSISYQREQLRSIDRRLTQDCDNALAPPRGRIRWNLRAANTAG